MNEMSRIDASDAFEAEFAAIPTVCVGGLDLAVLTRPQAAELMLSAARFRRRGRRPLYLTSANGEVIAGINRDADLQALFVEADQVVADGQPLVMASRMTGNPLPERVATTDLFHDVASRAEHDGTSFYLYGATPVENELALARVRSRYPRLRIAGSCHGYLSGNDLAAKLAEIDTLAPDILWLAMGVPTEQRFMREHSHRLSHVGVVKTSGGLFNFLSGTRARAPEWMQSAGLEWAWRLRLEPRRLFWRYLRTNPLAAWYLLTRTRPSRRARR